MTEFETASLALLEASFALREASLWATWATVFLGLVQIGIIYYGIRVMKDMGAQRTKEADKRDQADVRRHTEVMTRHTEVMTALEALISRNSTPQGA